MEKEHLAAGLHSHLGFKQVWLICFTFRERPMLDFYWLLISSLVFNYNYRTSFNRNRRSNVYQGYFFLFLLGSQSIFYKIFAIRNILFKILTMDYLTQSGQDHTPLNSLACCLSYPNVRAINNT